MLELSDVTAFVFDKDKISFASLLLSTWSLWISRAQKRREEAREKIKQDDERKRQERPIDFFAELIKVRQRDNTMESKIRIRLTNVSGKPVSIDPPLLEDDSGNYIIPNFERDYPFAMHEGAVVFSEIATLHVLQEWGNPEYLELFPVCRLSKGSVLHGRALRIQRLVQGKNPPPPVPTKRRGDSKPT